jgi:hypothetical protein
LSPILLVVLGVAVLGFLVAVSFLLVERRGKRWGDRSGLGLEISTADLPVLPPGRADPPPALLDALVEGECVLFAGAELGGFSDTPSRRQLLRILVEQNIEQFPREVLHSLRGQLEQADSELVAELIAARIPAAEIAATLEVLSFDPGWKPGGEKLLRLLAGMPFAGVVTDMWSTHAEMVFGGREPVVVTPSGQEEGSLGRLLRANRFFVAHLWGIAGEPDQLRLSWQQYRESLRESREFERFVSSLASSRSLLFLGTSVATVERFFEASAPSQRGSRSHFAVVPWEPGGLALHAQSLGDRFGVQLIPYRLRNGESEMLRLVERLQAATAPRRPRATPPRPPRVEAVRLENIGPFASLELSLGTGATVLLGDNGSGKSSVLRAIALAFSGEGPEVDRAARGLLRVGAKSGLIEVELEGETHRAALDRDGAEVSVRAQLSPVAEGLWLGLGFPPLRGVAAGQLDGPVVEPSVEPSVADLMPLAANEVDDRLGDLQQWVINMAVRAESDSQDGRECGQMLETFFELVADLTPGVAFEFAGVEKKTWRVMVKTEDGTLALDQLSRGMTAMFSWIGVLLRRLFQVYGEGPESPRLSHALVLVDEVDLHLHPGWQRLILPLLAKHFPNVQLIASTHSPLVVGSVPEANLIHLQRVGGEIVPRLLKEEFAGWRSDQILTSSAFDLATTRDSVTEERMAEYHELMARDSLDPGEHERATALADDLRRQMPSAQETERGREAAELVRGAIRERLSEFPAERREEVFAEAERYFEKLREDPAEP